jgi:hypothetical protein
MIGLQVEMVLVMDKIKIIHYKYLDLTLPFGGGRDITLKDIRIFKKSPIVSPPHSRSETPMLSTSTTTLEDLPTFGSNWD